MPGDRDILGIRCAPLSGSPAAACALTVDVEEWFHVCGVPALAGPDRWAGLESRLEADLQRVLAFCERHRARATFFVLGWLARRHPESIRRIAAAGHEIACHGDLHLPAYRLSPAAFEADLTAALKALVPLAGQPVAGYRAAQWSLGLRSTPWAFPILARGGIRYDSSLTRAPFLGSRGHPRAAASLILPGGVRLAEFPPLSGRLAGVPGVFLGGGWPLRLLGAGRAVREARGLLGRGLPAIFFLHPWELDPHPLRAPMPALKSFVHYAWLSRAPAIWERLLSSLPFRPLGETAARLAG